MSATTARDAGPSAADAAQIATDVAVASNAAPSAANDEVSAAAEEVTERQSQLDLVRRAGQELTTTLDHQATLSFHDEGPGR